MPGALKAKVNGTWVLASSASGGGGAEEIFVGASDPGTGYDLWIDTDEDAPLTDDTRWNTAWGIVATGTIFATNPLQLAGSFSKVTNPINLVTLVGRRYRITFQTRAVVTATAGTDASVNFGLYDNGASRIDLADWYCGTSGAGGTAYGSTEWGAVIEGDGAAHSYEIWGRAWGVNGVAHVSSNCRYYIEDVGPIAGSTLAVMSVNDRWNAAWGQIAASPGWDVALSAAAGVYTQVGTVTASVVAGRRYNFSLTTSAAYASTPGETWGWQEQIDGVSIGEHYWQVAVAGAYINPGTVNLSFTPGTSGVKTFVVTVRRVNGTGTMQCRGNFAIMDLGPVSTAVAVADPTPAWIPITTLGSGWSASVNNRSPSSYRKRGDMVDLRLAVQGGTSGTLITTLPAGYRPPGTLDLIGRDGGAQYAALFNINSDGSILWYGPGNSSIVYLIATFSVTS